MLHDVSVERLILLRLLREDSNERARIVWLEDRWELDETLERGKRACGLDLCPLHRGGKSIQQVDIDQTVVGATIQVVGTKEGVGRVSLMERGFRLHADGVRPERVLIDPCAPCRQAADESRESERREEQGTRHGPLQPIEDADAYDHGDAERREGTEHPKP